MRISIIWSVVLLCAATSAFATPTARVIPALWAEGDTPGELTVQGMDVTKPVTVTAYSMARTGVQTVVWQYTFSGQASVALPGSPFATAGFYQLQVSNGGQPLPQPLAVSVVAQPLPRLPGIPFFGLNTHFSQRTIPDSAYAALKLGNVDMVRDQWVWPAAEATAGNFRPITAPNGGPAYQKHMLAANGLQILHNCAYGNPLYDSGNFPQSAAARAQFAQYCAYVAQQFGATLFGSEVWNEPSVNSATLYAPLVGSTAAALAHAAPTSEVLQGGGGGVGGGADPLFEQTVYATLGAACCTGHSVHPYMTNPDVGYLALNSRLTNPVTGQAIVNMDFVTFWLDYLSHAVQKQRASNITEIGWYTVNDGGNGVSEEKQAAFTGRALLHASKPSACTLAGTVSSSVVSKYCSPSASATSPDLKSIFIYDFQDDGSDPGNPQDNYGLVHADLTPKMAYSAFAQSAGMLRGSTFYREITMGAHSLANAYVYDAGGGDSLIVLWTAEFRPVGVAKTAADMQYAPNARTQAAVSITDTRGTPYGSAALQCREWDGHPCSVDAGHTLVANLPLFVRIHADPANVQIAELAAPSPVTNLTVSAGRTQ